MAKRPKTPRWLEAARAAGAETRGEKPDWLSRALARAGVLPLDQAVAAISAGRVRLGGKQVRAPFAPVGPSSQVTLDGLLVDLAPSTLVLMFHKPRGVVTSDHDPQQVGTVFDRLRQVLAPEHQRFGWHAVGRLDRDTTGLLLFTNDERFVAHATSPATHLAKRYLASVSGQLSEPKLELLRHGLDLADGRTRPAQAQQREGRVVLTLTEGHNHQVKRMLGAVGLPVLQLHREAVGTLELDLAEGQYRMLTAAEVAERLGYTPRG